jgi:hypothetical protein
MLLQAPTHQTQTRQPLQAHQGPQQRQQQHWTTTALQQLPSSVLPMRPHTALQQLATTAPMSPATFQQQRQQPTPAHLAPSCLPSAQLRRQQQLQAQHQKQKSTQATMQQREQQAHPPAALVVQHTRRLLQTLPRHQPLLLLAVMVVLLLAWQVAPTLTTSWSRCARLQSRSLTCLRCALQTCIHWMPVMGIGLHD